MPKPHIVAEARLPAVLSFTAGPDPDLTISLRLVDAQTPITIAKDAQLQVFMATNAVLIREAASPQNIALPTLDVNMKSAPPLRLVPEEAVAAKSRFVTLEPGVSCDILRVPFRPRGATRKSVEGARAETARDGFLFAQLGVHLLEPGREYTVQVKSGVRISSWMEGRVEDLIQEGPGEWRPRPDAINVLPAEGFRFRVED